jgi:hypothetical protein
MIAVSAVTTLAAGSPAFAQAGTILEYSVQQAMKERLSGLTLDIEVVPAPAQYQDPGLVPTRYGQGAPVVIDGRRVIVTSWFLTDGARKVFVSRPGGTGEARSTGSVTDLSVARVSDDLVETTVVRELPEAGLAILAMPDSLATAQAAVPPAPGVLDRPDRSRVYYCISRVTQGVSVLTEVAVTDVAGPPLDRLLLAPGVIPAGTVLFDSTGIPYAVAARESWSGAKFTLIAPIAGALPPAPKKETPKDTRKVTPGVWLDTSEDREDGDPER